MRRFSHTTSRTERSHALIGTSRRRFRLAAVIGALALGLGALGGIAGSSAHPSLAAADSPANGGLFQSASGRLLDTRNGTGG